MTKIKEKSKSFFVLFSKMFVKFLLAIYKNLKLGRKCRIWTCNLETVRHIIAAKPACQWYDTKCQEYRRQVEVRNKFGTRKAEQL